jgi:hypothetical protein
MRPLSSGLLLALCCVFGAEAKTRSAVVGMGECADADLLRSLRLTTERLAKQPAFTLAPEADLVARVGVPPGHDVEEIQRQLDSAQQLFYQAQYHGALERVEATLGEIDRLPPGLPRWQLGVSAHLLEGLIRGRIRPGARTADMAFTDVLRLDPRYQLNTDYFSPSTVRHFEKLREQLARAPRHKLGVTSQPQGLSVFLDGREVGRTPLKLEVHPGAYRLQVGKGGRYSVPRTVGVEGPTEALVNFTLEGAIATRQPLCFDAVADEARRVDFGTRVGTLLGVGQLVVMRLDKRSIGPQWLSATLIDVGAGRKIREGGLELRSDHFEQEVLGELARFIATGETTSKVRVSTPPPPPEHPSQAASASQPSGPSAAPGASQPVPAGGPLAQRGRWQRPVGYGLLGAGGTLAATGVAFQLRAASANARYRALEAGGIAPEEAQAAREALDGARAAQTVALVGYGAGALALVGGAAVLLLRPDEEAPALALLPAWGPGGLGAVFSGRF